MDELAVLLQQCGLGDHKLTALLLRSPTGQTAVLPLRTFPAVRAPLHEPSPADSMPRSRNFTEWCRYRDISRTRGYQLLQEGRGPRILFVGKKRLVTPEADAEWLARMEEREGGVP